jgi:ubiquinone/menaquinone biosynthesis C-methylase UbiE
MSVKLPTESSGKIRHNVEAEISLSMDHKKQKYRDGNAEQAIALDDTFSLERYRQFAGHLPSGSLRVLDVGCAEGRGGAELHRVRPDVELSGLDCVAERLANLPPCYTGRIEGMTQEIPVDDRSFDAVVAGEFLEHLYPADVDPTLCEFQRILKIGGILLLTTPNPHSLKMRLRGGSVYGVAHLTQHFPSLLKKRLMLHGFSSVRVYGSGKAYRYLGQHFPLIAAYGSYLISARKS